MATRVRVVRQALAEPRILLVLPVLEVKRALAAGAPMAAVPLAGLLLVEPLPRRPRTLGLAKLERRPRYLQRELPVRIPSVEMLDRQGLRLPRVQPEGHEGSRCVERRTSSFTRSDCGCCLVTNHCRPQRGDLSHVMITLAPPWAMSAGVALARVPGGVALG